MNLNKGKSLNRLINLDPDEKVLTAVYDIFDQYVVCGSKPIGLLPTEFHEFFKNERIISFRQKIPKSLNQKGDAILQVPRVWVLYLFVMHLEGKMFKELLFTFKESLSIVKKQEELLDGLNLLLEKFPEINVTTEDESELAKLLGSRSGKSVKEVLAISECGQYALVKLPIDQQKRLKSSSAIVPIRNNAWIQPADILTTHSFTKLLAMSNYTYHPCP